MATEDQPAKLSASSVLEGILGNQADFGGLDDALKASLQTLREYLGVEVTATYLVAAGETSFSGAHLTAIAGAGFRRRERLVLPPILVEALAGAPSTPHFIGEAQAVGAGMGDVLPALADYSDGL